MRKAINTAAFLFFIWLLLDTLNIPAILLNFLLVGAIPGTNMTLSANVMLGIIGLIGGIAVFEMLARRIQSIWRIRQSLKNLIAKRERLPTRRYTRA